MNFSYIDFVSSRVREFIQVFIWVATIPTLEIRSRKQVEEGGQGCFTVDIEYRHHGKRWSGFNGR
jgi:hypothetical protein